MRVYPGPSAQESAEGQPGAAGSPGSGKQGEDGQNDGEKKGKTQEKGREKGQGEMRRSSSNFAGVAEEKTWGGANRAQCNEWRQCNNRHRGNRWGKRKWAQREDERHHIEKIGDGTHRVDGKGAGSQGIETTQPHQQ